MITTMTAPEGKFGSNAEIITPMPAQAEPNKADSKDIDHTPVVQRRAVAAGIVNLRRPESNQQSLVRLWLLPMPIDLAK